MGGFPEDFVSAARFEEQFALRYAVVKGSSNGRHRSATPTFDSLFWCWFSIGGRSPAGGNYTSAASVHDFGGYFGLPVQPFRVVRAIVHVGGDSWAGSNLGSPVLLETTSPWYGDKLVRFDSAVSRCVEWHVGLSDAAIWKLSDSLANVGNAG